MLSGARTWLISTPWNMSQTGQNVLNVQLLWFVSNVIKLLNWIFNLYNLVVGGCWCLFCSFPNIVLSLRTYSCFEVITDWNVSHYYKKKIKNSSQEGDLWWKNLKPVLYLHTGVVFLISDIIRVIIDDELILTVSINMTTFFVWHDYKQNKHV